MNKYVTDTMAIILRLEKRKLPKKVKEVFEDAEKNQSEIIVPAMVFAEIAYLSENNRIDTNLEVIKSYLRNHKGIYENPLTFENVITAFRIDDIPELHDRLIAAVAMQLNIEILTNDPEIQKSSYVKTIWR